MVVKESFIVENMLLFDCCKDRTTRSARSDALFVLDLQQSAWHETRGFGFNPSQSAPGTGIPRMQPPGARSPNSRRCILFAPNHSLQTAFLPTKTCSV